LLAAMQRLAEGAHYLSDVLIGAAIGLAFAALWLPAGGFGAALRPLESLGETQPFEADVAKPSESTADASTR